MTAQPSGETATSTTQRIGWTILMVVTLSVCYFSNLGVVGFVGPDEPRYAWIARDMVETAIGSRRGFTESRGLRSQSSIIGAPR